MDDLFLRTIAMSEDTCYTQLQVMNLSIVGLERMTQSLECSTYPFPGPMYPAKKSVPQAQVDEK